jgi:hypothetical protein
MHDPPVKKTKTVVSLPAPYPQISGWSPETIVEPGAGVKWGLLDSEFATAGATINADAARDAEPGKAATVPAVVNAILDPIGKCLRQLPVKSRLWRSIAASQVPEKSAARQAPDAHGPP